LRQAGQKKKELGTNGSIGAERIGVFFEHSVPNKPTKATADDVSMLKGWENSYE
jgi:hypothetical protein